MQTIEQQYELVRATSEEERRRTSETLSALYEEAAGQAHSLLHQSAERFAEIMQSLKQMSADMQQELENTRGELRRGIFELPQETAESAAQMRRVIVDQIEALAELNRIVARHGRSLDTTEPMRPEPARREAEPAYTNNARPQSQPRPAPGREIPVLPVRNRRAAILPARRGGRTPRRRKAETAAITAAAG